MPVTPTSLADHYVSIAHFHGVNQSDTWRGLFHIRYQPGVIPQPTDAIFTHIQSYWVANVRDDCVLDHLELRNWTYGPQPFSLRPAIWQKNIGVIGDKNLQYGASGNIAYGKEVVAFVRITNQGPKSGKQFIRQLFDSGDIAAVPGGAWQFFAPPSTIVPNVTPAKYQTALGATGISAFFGVAPPAIVVVHFSAKAWNASPIPANSPFSSAVTGMALVGPTVNKATRKNKR